MALIVDCSQRPKKNFTCGQALRRASAIWAQTDEHDLLLLYLEARANPRRIGMSVAGDVEHAMAGAAVEMVVMTARQLVMRSSPRNDHGVDQPLGFEGAQHAIDRHNGKLRQGANGLPVNCHRTHRL